MITDVNGVVCYDADFYPFGGERPYTNNCTTHYKFEGKERDVETGNDYFGARYYTNRFGRWLSADWSAVPAAVPYANLTNPQTLNLYSMVSDDPESFADLDGHCTKGGKEKGWLWCLFRYSDQDAQRDKEAKEAQAELRAFFREHPEYMRRYQYQMAFVALFTAGIGAAAAGEAGGSAGGAWVRVGRWMSTEELENMQASGAAQESPTLGGSRVAFPASADAYKGAASGSVYVEYDVPAGSLKPAGSGWARIPGPNSIEGRAAAAAGRAKPAMPPVKNIKVVGTKE